MPTLLHPVAGIYGDPAISRYSQQTVIVNNFASSQVDMYAAIVAQGKGDGRSHVRRSRSPPGPSCKTRVHRSSRTQWTATRDGYHMDYGATYRYAVCAPFSKTDLRRSTA